MRLFEFSIDEADAGPAYKEIARQLAPMGYKQIGSGADARVWAKDTSHVIKILMPDEPLGRATEVFKKFAEFCAAHQGVKCLPRINEYNDIDILGQDYVQIDMERLYPIKKNSFNEGVVWFFSDFVAGQAAWESVEYVLGLADTWTEYSKKQASRLADAWQSLSMSGNIDDYKTLYEVMVSLYHTGSINKFGWDLHTENVMQRSNGDLVIIDPWFAGEKMSK